MGLSRRVPAREKQLQQQHLEQQQLQQQQQVQQQQRTNSTFARSEQKAFRSKCFCCSSAEASLQAAARRCFCSAATAANTAAAAAASRHKGPQQAQQPLQLLLLASQLANPGWLASEVAA